MSVNAMKTTEENGKTLLNAIESLDFTKAVEFLQQNHKFSKKALFRALMSACQHGHELLVQTIVHSGASVHRKDKFGNTPLIICTQNGFVDIVRFLIEKKVDVSASNFNGDTALFLSISLSGSSEITKLLLEHSRKQFDHQNKALKKAVEVRNVEAFNMLLDIKVKNNEKLMKTDNHVHKPAKSIVGNYVGSAVQHVQPHTNPKKKLKRSPGQLGVKTTMPMSCARPAGATLECELNEIFRSMFLNHSWNTTNSLSDAEMTIIMRLQECGADVNTSLQALPYLTTRSEMFEIDESCEIRDLNKLTKASGVWKGTPLQFAAEIGHYELIKLLLKYQPRVNEDNFLQSALHWALLSGHTDCAKLLLQHGAKMHVIYALVTAVKFQIPSYMEFLCENYQDEIVSILQKFNNLNTFVRAAVRGTNLQILTQIFEIGGDCSNVYLPLAESRNGDIARFLIEKGADVNVPKKGSHWNKTPLLQVISRREYTLDNIELIQVLLENGASVNDKDCKQQTPLIIAACSHGSNSLLQLLIDHGADLSSKDHKGNNALICAIQADLDCASLLIKLAEDRKDVINAQNNEGLTALMAAAAVGRTDLIKKLLRHGADVHIKDNRGNTALFHYLSSGCKNRASVNDRDCRQQKPLIIAACSHGNNSLLQLLIDHGADLGSKDHKGNNALICAAQTGLKCASFLIKLTKDRKDVLNAQNNHGLTALMAAAAVERVDLIKKLLSHGADVHIKDSRGNTALFHYLSSGCKWDTDLLHMLVSAGSDVNWRNKDGLSPLMVAAKRCLPWTLTNVLFNSGVDVNAVCEKDQTRTALSFVPVRSSLQINVVIFIESLLDRGVDASYVNPHYLPQLILSVQEKYIPDLIRCGLGPSVIQLHDPRKSGINVLSTVSPLCLALLVGNVPLAQYFVENVFLTKYDISSVCNNGLRDFLHRKQQQDCLDFLETINLQPWSLFNLALVAVSSAVGTSHGRESRVNTLPLPEKMKQKLLYRTEDVELKITRNIDTLSEMQYRGIQIRKFKDYYNQAWSPLYLLINTDYCAQLGNLDYIHSDDSFDYDADSNSSIHYDSDDCEAKQ